MSQVQQTVSPLRQRMIEDMNVRHFTYHTQRDYIRAVKRLADFLGHSPDKATAEDLRLFLIHLSENGVTPSTINVTISALRFFFDYTVDTPEVVRRLKSISLPRKIPVILTPEEVHQLIDATDKLKYKTMFALGYGAGLRVKEICHLKVNDIDSKRMVIRIDQGKGKKDRYAMLSDNLLKLLRAWWKEGHTRGRLYDSGWLFPGINPVNPLSPRQVSRVFKSVVAESGINKTATMHSLRHSYATFLLEHKVDIRVIQVLLGHNKIETTTRYTQVATNLLKETTSPLDEINLPTL